MGHVGLANWFLLASYNQDSIHTGQLETTEKTYKYHMQVQDDEDTSSNTQSSPDNSVGE